MRKRYSATVPYVMVLVHVPFQCNAPGTVMHWNGTLDPARDGTCACTVSVQCARDRFALKRYIGPFLSTLELHFEVILGPWTLHFGTLDPIALKRYKKV